MRMYKTFFFLLFMGACVHLFAQKGSSHSLGAKSLGMGGTGVADNSIDGILYNQASLADLEQTSFILATERKFNLADLTGVSVGIGLPLKRSGSFGIVLSNYGNDVYSEQKVGLAYGRKLAKKTNIGAQIDVLNHSITSFGNAAVATFEAGLTSGIIKNVQLGFHVFSPAQISITQDENVLTRFRLGLRYTPSMKVILAAEVDQFIDQRPSFRGGVSYAILDNLMLRVGYNTSVNEGSYSFGAGYIWKDIFNIDMAFVVHESLGITPGISIIYKRPKKQSSDAN